MSLGLRLLQIQVPIRDTLLNLYSESLPEEISGGKSWYYSAHRQAQELADRYNIPLVASTGVIAAISPGLSWEYNIPQAETLIQYWAKKNPLPTLGVYVTRTARRI